MFKLTTNDLDALAQDESFVTYGNLRVTTIELQEHNLQRMTAGVSLFVFKKAKGELRKAIGTLNPAFIPKERSTEPAKKQHKPAPNTQSFFDLQANEFRSYNMDLIIAIIEF